MYYQDIVCWWLSESDPEPVALDLMMVNVNTCMQVGGHHVRPLPRAELKLPPINSSRAEHGQPPGVRPVLQLDRAAGAGVHTPRQGAGGGRAQIIGNADGTIERPSQVPSSLATCVLYDSEKILAAVTKEHSEQLAAWDGSAVQLPEIETVGLFAASLSPPMSLTPAAGVVPTRCATTAVQQKRAPHSPRAPANAQHVGDPDLGGVSTRRVSKRVKLSAGPPAQAPPPQRQPGEPATDPPPQLQSTGLFMQRRGLRGITTSNRHGVIAGPLKKTYEYSMAQQLSRELSEKKLGMVMSS
eukprot:COSAG05_NODE_730_length_7672_cov_341.864783_4_plen_298_part_00